MKFKKILCSILILLILFTQIPQGITFASDTDDPMLGVEGVDSGAVENENKAIGEILGDGFGKVIDGIVGIFTIYIRVVAVAIGGAVQGVASLLAKSEGTVSGEDVGLFVTPADILFNKLLLTDIDFFDTNTSSSTINTIRTNIANWYYVIRNLSIIILLAILIYIGIRMALSTVAEQKAIYKRMLIDWFASFVLVFVLQYIIYTVIYINGEFVKLMSTTIPDKFGAMIGALPLKAIHPLSASIGFGATIIYIIMVAMIFAFLFIYLKRMITIGFLIIISPLITITYSIDKLGDNKSQAVNTWLKEFVYNVLIQPFHCIIYLAFVSTAIDSLNGTLSGMVLAIIMMSFIFFAEGIVKKIFGFEKASSLGNGAQSMLAVYGGFKALKSLSGGDKKSTSNVQGASNGGGSSGGGSGGTGNSANSAPTMPKVKNNVTNNTTTTGGSSTSGNTTSGNTTRGSKVANSAAKAKSYAQQKGGQIANKVKAADKAISSVPIIGAIHKANKRMANPKAVGAILGGSMAMAAGDFDKPENIIAGGMAGSATTSGIANKAKSAMENVKVKGEERTVATAYNNLKTSGGYTDTQMSTMSNAYLAATPEQVSTISNVDEKLYAESLQAMQGTYKNIGSKNPSSSVKDLITKIQTKEIKPNNF